MSNNIEYKRKETGTILAPPSPRYNFNGPCVSFQRADEFSHLTFTVLVITFCVVVPHSYFYYLLVFQLIFPALLNGAIEILLLSLNV